MRLCPALRKTRNDSIFFAERSLEIRMKSPTNDLRVIAEIQYKIGLGFLVLTNYDGAIAALKEAQQALDGEVDAQKENSDDASAAKIKEIEELKGEIESKIVEIEEEKKVSEIVHSMVMILGLICFCIVFV